MRNIEPFKSNPNFKFVNHNIIEPLDIEEKLDQVNNLTYQASSPHYQKIHYFQLILVSLGRLIC